jgi:PPOX class probable F420-dependent enzyme
MSDPFAGLAGADHVSLVSLRRDGARVATAVWFAVVDGKLYLRTIADSGKVRRVRREPRVELAPCTADGSVTGPYFAGRARVLAPDDPACARANEALDARYGEERAKMTRMMAEQGRALVYLEVSAAG